MNTAAGTRATILSLFLLLAVPRRLAAEVSVASDVENVGAGFLTDLMEGNACSTRGEILHRAAAGAAGAVMGIATATILEMAVTGGLRHEFAAGLAGGVLGGWLGSRMKESVEPATPFLRYEAALCKVADAGKVLRAPLIQRLESKLATTCGEQGAQISNPTVKTWDVIVYCAQGNPAIQNQLLQAVHEIEDVNHGICESGVAVLKTYEAEQEAKAWESHSSFIPAEKPACEMQDINDVWRTLASAHQ